MREPSEGRPARLRLALLGLGALVILGLVVGWFLYTAVWGFGGLYTINYLPTPDRLISASIAAPSGDLSNEKRNAVYRVQQPLDEVVVFYQQALPATGWRVVEQGAFASSSGGPGYCLIVEQRGVRADIWMVDSNRDETTGVYIHFDDPALCDDELHRR